MTDEMMTVADVQERLAEIEHKAGDAEMAHIAEKRLWHDVLQAIADGRTVDSARMAAMAVSSSAIDFDRWYA